MTRRRRRRRRTEAVVNVADIGNDDDDASDIVFHRVQIVAAASRIGHFARRTANGVQQVGRVAGTVRRLDADLRQTAQRLAGPEVRLVTHAVATRLLQHARQRFVRRLDVAVAAAAVV